MEIIKTIRNIVINTLIVTAIAYAITKDMKKSLIIGSATSIFCKFLNGKNMLEGLEDDLSTQIKKGFLTEEEKEAKKIVKNAQNQLERAINAINYIKESETKPVVAETDIGPVSIREKVKRSPKKVMERKKKLKATKKAEKVLKKALNVMNQVKNMQIIADAPRLEDKPISTEQKRSRLSMQEQKITDKIQEDKLRKELKAKRVPHSKNPEYGYSFLPPSEWSKEINENRRCIPEKVGGCAVCPTQGINLSNGLSGNYLELDNVEQMPPMPTKQENI